MNGVITAINVRTRFYSIRLESGEFAVVENIDSHEPEIGDLISGELESCGDCTLSNRTQREEFDVIVQGAHCSENRARQLLSR